MRMLYCATRNADLTFSASDPETAFLENLCRAGNEITAVIGFHDDVQISEFRPGREPGRQRSAASDSNEYAEPDGAFVAQVRDFLTQGSFDVLIVRGLSLNLAALSGDITSEIVWSLLTGEDVNELGADESALSNMVEASAAVILMGNDAHDAVRTAAPGVRHKVVSLEWGAKSPHNMQVLEQELEQLTSRMAAERRVLLYVDRPEPEPAAWAASAYATAIALASDLVHVVIMCHDGTKSFGNLPKNRNVTVVEPRPAPHQVSDGRLLPRYAAWHVAVAASELSCSAVLTEDLETVVFGLTNSTLRPRLWPIVRFGDLGEFQEQAKTYDQLAETVPRIVFADHERRAIFESKVPSATSKTVVLAGLASPTDVSADLPRHGHLSELLKTYLDRFVADYTAVAKMPDPQRLVLAGHDFKFAGELVDVLSQRSDIELRVDHWAGQTVQDVPTSKALLAWADIIFCEFASHNAVWYSWEKLEGQTLIVRFHGYELWSPWIQDINLANVDKIVFVSRFYRDKVVQELGWPRHKTEVIPNVVDTLDLARPKVATARFHLGMAGIVPILKRPDRALDLLEGLLREDPRYTLHIRGRAPWEYGWMWKDPDIRDAYMAFYERLAMNPGLRRRVAFDEFGPDMGRWFQNIGWALSPSFRETFHLAPVEGMASGAVPVVWARDGAVEIFRNDWVHEDTEQAVRYILETNADESVYNRLQLEAIKESSRYDALSNGQAWLELIFGTVGVRSDTPAQNVKTGRVEQIFADKPTADSFRWLVSTLIRDGRRSRISELVLQHSDYLAELPPYMLFEHNWQQGVEALKNNFPQIPERASGASFLPRKGAVMVAVHPERRAQTRIRTEIPDGYVGANLHLVTMLSPAIDPQSQKSGGGRSVMDSEHPPVVQLFLSNTSALTLDKYVQVAADALVREARSFRPTAIAAQQEFWISIPALIAARRLGVPFIMEDGKSFSGRSDSELSGRVGREADSRFGPGESPLDAVEEALQHHGLSIPFEGQPVMADLKVGVIADEFTSRTIAHSFKTVPLSREDGYLQVAATDFDAIFVESAWEGPEGEWRRRVAFHPDRIGDLERIISTARARNIPVIFWNKEDPVHFSAFEKTAAMADHIFTTDADMIGKYLRTKSSTALSVASLPFYAEPKIHNPLPRTRDYSHTVSYAGTYYGDRFPKRSLELHRILDAARKHGLTIYDRQVTVENSPYRFPADLAGFVREGVPYDEVLDVYKAHPVSINVNSADDSPTMFSRRVVEIAASGSVVLSGRGRGIVEQIQGIQASDSAHNWGELLQKWMTNENLRIADAWSQMRTITRSHLAEHSLSIMMRTAGIPVKVKNLPQYAFASESLEAADVDKILQQTWLPAAIYCDVVSSEAIRKLKQHGLDVIEYAQLASPSTEWLALKGEIPSNTYFEDLLHATRFGEWDYISARPYVGSEGVGVPLIELQRNGIYSVLCRTRQLADPGQLKSLTWVMPGAGS